MHGGQATPNRPQGQAEALDAFATCGEYENLNRKGGRPDFKGQDGADAGQTAALGGIGGGLAGGGELSSIESEGGVALPKGEDYAWNGDSPFSSSYGDHSRERGRSA